VFNTGTISGTPIASSDPVTYTVTAFGLFFFFSDTATVVIAVGVGDMISADCDEWGQRNTKSI
jgi:hypothetical protein